MDKDTLQKTIETLFHKLLYVQSNLTIYKTISNNCSPGNKYEKLLSVSPHFFTMLLRNLQSMILIELSKVFEESKECMGIDKLINICDANNHLFLNDTKEKIRINEKSEILQNIEEAKEEYEKTQTIRNNLKGVRDKVLAHNDKKYFCDPAKAFSEYPIKWEETEELIRVGMKVCNTYLVYLTDELFASKHYNEDDVEKLLNYAKIGVEEKEKERNERIRKIKDIR